MPEGFSGELLKLVKQKGVYLYEYMDRCNFFSSLKDECISEKDYLKVSNIWNLLKINTMGDYHDLYSKTDVLLLSNVFEKFVNTCYGLLWIRSLSLF